MQILLSDFFQFDVLLARRRRASSSKHRVIATWSLRVFEHCFSIEFPIVFRLSTDLLKPCVDSMLHAGFLCCSLCTSFTRANCASLLFDRPLLVLQILSLSKQPTLGVREFSNSKRNQCEVISMSSLDRLELLK